MGDAIRAALETGPSIGSAVFGPGGYVAERLARLGFPWLIADLQHGACSWESLLSTIQGIELGGARAIVRVPWPEPAAIMRALDLGAAGVIVPMIEDAAQAAAIAGACRYPPDGYRSYGPVRSAYDAGPAKPAAPLCLAMIETGRGMDNLAAIVATDGIDGIVLGPSDLALSLGLPIEAALDDRILAHAAAIAEACNRSGKIAGSFSFNPAMTTRLLNVGMRFISVGADALFMAQGAAWALDFLRAADPANRKIAEA